MCPSGAHAVTLAWLPILASCLTPSSSDMDPPEDQLDLLPAVAEELWRPLHQGVLCCPSHIHNPLLNTILHAVLNPLLNTLPDSCTGHQQGIIAFLKTDTCHAMLQPKALHCCLVMQCSICRDAIRLKLLKFHSIFSNNMQQSLQT